MAGPLAGVRVIEMGAYTAGPLCGRYLSNLGAEVIKVEPIKGDPLRGFAFKVAAPVDSSAFISGAPGAQ